MKIGGFIQFTILSLLFSQTSFATDIECEFEKSFVVNLLHGDESSVEIKKYLKIDDNKTDPKVLALDGSIRAVNSILWSDLGKGKDLEVTRRYIGDKGEILAVTNLAGPRNSKIKIATLQYTYEGYSVTFLGGCKPL